MHRQLPLAYDSLKVSAYQHDARYDYNSQLVNQHVSLWELFTKWINKALGKVFGSQFAETYTEPILIGAFIIIVLLLVYFVYKKRPELFVRRKKAPLPYELEEENIYDVDFDVELLNSLRQEDYRLAIRLTYLQTLRHLNDHSYIDWQLHKTPTEYLYEMKKPDCKAEFRQLTNHFLRIRYGNFEASKAIYETVRDLQAQIKKGGMNEGEQ